MVMNIYKANIDDGTEAKQHDTLEGTNLFSLLSADYPNFDNDPLLDPNNVSTDGSVHPGTKIVRYLLKQDGVKYVDAWQEYDGKKDYMVPLLIGGGTYGQYKRNKQMMLFTGEFVDSVVQRYKEKGVQVHTEVLKETYKPSYLNKVMDNRAKQYENSFSLF